MQITISARHGHLSDQTQQKISEKSKKLLKFFDRITAIEVTVDLEHHEETVDVEIRASAERTDAFVARDSASELFAALDGVIHKIEQQLRKHKERLQTSHRQPGRKQMAPPLEGESDSE